MFPIILQVITISKQIKVFFLHNSIVSIILFYPLFIAPEQDPDGVGPPKADVPTNEPALESSTNHAATTTVVEQARSASTETPVDDPNTNKLSVEENVTVPVASDLELHTTEQIIDQVIQHAFEQESTATTESPVDEPTPADNPTSAALNSPAPGQILLRRSYSSGNLPSAVRKEPARRVLSILRKETYMK